MNEFRVSSIKGLVSVPILLGFAQSAIATPNEQVPIERDARLLIAQAADPVVEPDATFYSGIQSGSAHTLVTTDGSTTQIEGGVQSGSNLFHRFDGFGIGVGETANFVTPEATQAVFGQVAGGGASYIDGRLQVSGSDADLYLINPAGVLFGPDAQLNLGGSLTVTSSDQVGFGKAWLDLAATGDDQFDYTNFTGTPEAYRFTTDTPGAVANQADLAVGEGEAIRLVGGDVVNTGRLNAAGGEVTLTAVGESGLNGAPNRKGPRLVRLGSQGALLSVEVAGDAVEQGAWNPLSVPELLTGGNPDSGAGGLRVNEDGSVDLLADETVVSAFNADTFGGSVLSAGDVDVSGSVGGEINLFGAEINVLDGQLEASGEQGGGLIQVGGGYQGQGELPRAGRVLFGERAIARADGLVEGNGGQIVLWSDGETQFNGQLSANASGAGVGGLVETSGLQRLGVGAQASVSTQAESGQLGTWLLDPDNLRVVATGDGAAVVGGTNAPSGASEIDPTVLVTALNGSNVELQANDTITVDAAVNARNNAMGGNLTLNAPKLNLNERITLRAGGSGLSASDTAKTVNVGSNGSVQNAIDAVAKGGTINLAEAIYSEPDRPISITKDLTLRGQGAERTLISGNNQRRVIGLSAGLGNDPTDDINVTIDRVSIVEGKADRGGGIAAFNGVNLLLTNSIVEDNNTTKGNPQIGGGLFFSGTGNSTIRNSIIRDNFAQKSGGGLAVDGAHKLLIEDSQFIGNEAVESAGAVAVGNDFVTISGGLFGQNTADVGGAIAVLSGSVDISTGATFTGNGVRLTGKGTRQGGAIFLQGRGLSRINRSTFNSNIATSDGGAIFLGAEHQLALSNSTLYDNTAQSDGGAVRVSDGLLEVKKSTFSGNHAGRDGGGLALDTEGTVEIESTTIANNTADNNGGGIARRSGAKPTISRTIIAGNTAAVFNQDVEGDISSGGYNLIEDRSLTQGYVDSDLPAGTDPLLGLLVDNGSGLLTLALLPGSPAIDAGELATSGEKDQRGTNIVGYRDIGAYESPRMVSDLFFIESENQFSTVVNTDYSSLFQVKVVDDLGAALAGIQVDFTLPTSGASGVANEAASSLITDTNGIAFLAAKAGRVAGNYTLLARTADDRASGSTVVTNRAGAASKFSLSGPTSILTAGDQVDFSVTARDRFDNVADSYSSTVQFSSSDARALLPERGVLTNGVGSFQATPIAAGTQTLSVTDILNPELVTNIGNIRVGAATAATFILEADGRGQIADVGSAFGNGLTVQVEDRFSNPVTGEAVTFSVPDGSDGAAGGFLDETLVLTDSDGRATARVVANEVAGSYEAIASAFGKSGSFRLENAAVPVPNPPVDPVVPVDPIIPVDPVVPVDPVPESSALVEVDTANPVPVNLEAENLLSLSSGALIPPEGTTDVEPSSDLLSEDEPRDEASSLSRNTVFDEVAFAKTEQLLTDEYTKHWRLPNGKASTLEGVQKVLQQAATHHQAKSAVVYALFVPPGEHDYSNQYPSVLSQRLLRDETDRDLDQLLLVMVPPEGQPVQQLIAVSRSEIVRQAQLLSIEISLIEDQGYQPLARQLYDWLLAPIAPDLEKSGVDNLMYVLDEGLRTVPLSAMMTSQTLEESGDRYAIEDYGISILPSMGLLNADFDTAPAEQNVLAAGADQFETLAALPAVPVELDIVGAASTSVQTLLNEAFSLERLLEAQASSPKTMMHLATHAAFNPGALDRSYVQLWDKQLKLNEISELDLEGLEMLILSACSTAMGSRDAELGFAGLASATGVEASIGSLWNVSDVGTMALMAEFYEHLRQDPLRFVALQQAQLSLLRGETWLENNKLITQKGESVLPDGFVGANPISFSHPFFWSGFTLIGSPWW